MVYTVSITVGGSYPLCALAYKHAQRPGSPIFGIRSKMYSRTVNMEELVHRSFVV